MVAHQVEAHRDGRALVERIRATIEDYKRNKPVLLGTVFLLRSGSLPNAFRMLGAVVVIAIVGLSFALIAAQRRAG